MPLAAEDWSGRRLKQRGGDIWNEEGGGVGGGGAADVTMTCFVDGKASNMKSFIAKKGATVLQGVPEDQHLVLKTIFLFLISRNLLLFHRVPHVTSGFLLPSCRCCCCTRQSQPRAS